jgi:lipoic acid synthetase
LLEKVVQAKPDVLAHNLETVKRLQKKIRDPRATYQQSLSVLKNAKTLNPTLYTKTSIMVGIGETEEEILAAMDDLLEIRVDFLTLGQYLQPTPLHFPIKRFISPEEFEHYKKIGEKKGFQYVAAGPLVRSSYKAGEFFKKNKTKKEEKK